MKTYEAVLLRFLPDKVAGEQLNIGVAVFSEGRAHVHMMPHWRRIEAAFPGTSTQTLATFADRARIASDNGALDVGRFKQMLFGLERGSFDLSEPIKGVTANPEAIAGELFRKYVMHELRLASPPQAAHPTHRRRITNSIDTASEDLAEWSGSTSSGGPSASARGGGARTMIVLRCARCHRQASIERAEDAAAIKWRVWEDGSAVCRSCLEAPLPPAEQPGIQLSAPQRKPPSYPASDLRNPRHAEFYALQRAHDDAG